MARTATTLQRKPAAGPCLDVPGILHIYNLRFGPTASTIMEHVDAFRRFSRFTVWNVNTEQGFPEGLNACRFRTILLHYSLFGPTGPRLGEPFLEYLDRSKSSYKIALIQDEYYGCPPRFAFLNRFNFDCVYTLVEPDHFYETYQRNTSVPKLVYNLPGYVSDDLLGLARRYTKADHARSIDIGYRGRKLLPHTGRGGREKYDIAVEFRRRAAGLGLNLDIEAEEHHRIYGDRWYQFMGDCRAVLGVEAGVSIFDLDDSVQTEFERLVATHPHVNPADLSVELFQQWEGNIPYRTISPRHFEAAALRTCQILFPGNYSGVLQAMVHYIPLNKDFSNFSDVIRMFKDQAFRLELTENAYRDLIGSGRYSYRSFISSFDDELERVGMRPAIARDQIEAVNDLLDRDKLQREIRARIAAMNYYPFPGRRLIWPIIWPFLRAATKIRIEIARARRSGFIA